MVGEGLSEIMIFILPAPFQDGHTKSDTSFKKADNQFHKVQQTHHSLTPEREIINVSVYYVAKHIPLAVTCPIMVCSVFPLYTHECPQTND